MKKTFDYARAVGQLSVEAALFSTVGSFFWIAIGRSVNADFVFRERPVDRIPHRKLTMPTLSPWGQELTPQISSRDVWATFRGNGDDQSIKQEPSPTRLPSTTQAKQIRNGPERQGRIRPR